MNIVRSSRFPRLPASARTPARAATAKSLRLSTNLLWTPLPAALLMVVAAGCNRQGSAASGKQQEPVAVETAVARMRDVQRSVQVVGTLYGEEDASISNKVPGKVVAIFKDVGDRAEPGEPLAQLLKNDYLLSVQQKRSALLESLAKLGLNDVPQDGFDIGTLPTVRRAKLQAENAEAKFNRGKQLFEQKPPLVSQQDFEDLQTAFSVAKSNYDVEAATANGLIGEARTRLADLRIAEQALADTTVRAPRDAYALPDMNPTTRPGAAVLEATGGTLPGVEQADPEAITSPGASATSGAATRPNSDRSYVVARRFANEGELLSAITPMFRLVDDDPLKLKAAVPERYFRDLKVGQKVTIQIDAYPSKFDGQVTRISPQVDEANRTFPVEIRVPNAERWLPPGAFARAAIDTKQEQAVFVPTAAVTSFAGVDKVFVIDNGKAREVIVELGEPQGKETEIRTPLKGGEVLAVGSVTSRLATGMPVNAKPPGEGKGSGTTKPSTRPRSASQPAGSTRPVAD